MLASLPGLYGDLEAALTRPERRHDKSDEGKRRNSAKGAGVSLNGKVVDLRDEIHAELVRMVRWVIEERNLHAWPADTEQAMASWLAAHVDWMCEQPDVDDTHDNLDRLTRAAHSLAFPRGRHQVVCGRCLEVTACDVESRKPLQCPGNLVVEWTEPADLEPEGIDCTVCGKTWPHRYWSDLGDKLRESA
ncbi:MAG TPA: hypothetical protein VFB19_18525 [Mycobacterium sp.]|nr:hypothetical protein [Mycobacterium sp.]